MITAVKSEKGGGLQESSQTAFGPPKNKVILNMFVAALEIAQGKTVTSAARAAGLSINALKSYRRRYPMDWKTIFTEAEKKLATGNVLPPIKFPATDCGLTRKALHGIRTATKLLATGLEHKEVSKILKLKPTTIRHWQSAYSSYWARCLNKATKKNKMESKTETAAAPLSPTMNLLQFFAGYVLPLCLVPRSTSPATLKEYAGALKHWAFYTGDPPVNEITALKCANFLGALSDRVNRRGEKISPNTVRKICIHLQFIFDRLGPRTPKNRMGAGLLGDSPWLDKPRRRNKPPTDSFGLEEISEWIKAAKNATVPQIDGLSPVTWWKALILFTYNTGLRIGSVMRLRWPMLSGNVLTIPGDCYKGGDCHQFTLSGAGVEAISPLKKFQEIYPAIFPWPHGFHYLQTIRREMLKASNIPEAHRYGFHALRKSMATELAKINPYIAQAALGHMSLLTTMNHYVNPQAMTDALKNLPQPK